MAFFRKRSEDVNRSDRELAHEMIYSHPNEQQNEHVSHATKGSGAGMRILLQHRGSAESAERCDRFHGGPCVARRSLACPFFIIVGLIAFSPSIAFNKD